MPSVRWLSVSPPPPPPNGIAHGDGKVDPSTGSFKMRPSSENRIGIFTVGTPLACQLVYVSARTQNILSEQVSPVDGPSGGPCHWAGLQAHL